MSKHSQVMGLGISLALVNACSGTSIPIKYNDIRLSNPFGDSYYAVALDRGQIKVVASDFAGVSLGLCADKFGAVEHRNCTANGEGFAFDRPKVNELSKGNFGQYTQLKSLTSTSGAGIGPVDAKLATVDAQYEVVYEWSRFKTVDVPASELTPNATAISSGDYGVAFRLVMGVSMKSAAGSVDANLGFGKLSAALEERRAQVSVRFAILGASHDFLPEKIVRIDSSADLFEALDDFHKIAKDINTKLNTQCSTPEPNACPLKPEMLAYYVRGEGIGSTIRAQQVAVERCVAALKNLQEFARKKTLKGIEIQQNEDAKKDRHDFCTVADPVESLLEAARAERRQEQAEGSSTERTSSTAPSTAPVAQLTQLRGEQQKQQEHQKQQQQTQQQQARGE